MFWLGEISADGTEIDVYDHEDDLIATVENDGSGINKQIVKDVAFGHMEGDQPSAYNQTLIACMATDQIKIERADIDGQ